MLTIELTYNIKTNEFKINSNCKQPKDIILDFLRTQIGQGVDNNPPNNDQDIYNINIDLDLSEDRFTVDCNCGNKGLRDGILMAFINQK